MENSAGEVALWTATCTDAAGRTVKLGVTCTDIGIVLLTPDGGHLQFDWPGSVDLVSGVTLAGREIAQHRTSFNQRK